LIIDRSFLQGERTIRATARGEDASPHEVRLTTPYDRVVYPTAVFAQTHPERLAVLARLAGLDPVAPNQARMLEIGGGNCFNLLSLAAIYPGSQAHGFDLSQVAIARGQEIAQASGLANVTLAVEDIMAAHERYAAGSFDYVTVHGVYAWVPDAVREATMALIAHVLSDRGVAYVSYNCMPGGHVRLIMREMLLDATDDIADPDEKIAATRDFLEAYAKPKDDDDTFARTLRHHASAMLERPDAVLFHDELGPCYHPQRFLDVVAAAEANGLRFLTDAGRNLHLDGFLKSDAPTSGDPERAVLGAASLDDYTALRFFRQSLFVRARQQPDRTIRTDRMAGLYLSTKLKQRDDGAFMLGEDEIEIAHEALADGLARAAAAYPQRVALDDLTQDPALRRVVLQLFCEWYVNLHLEPAPFPDRPGDNPQTSPLIRGLLSLGDVMVSTLDHGLLKVEQPELRRLLMAADGSRSVAEIAKADTGIPPEDIEAALTASARRALLRG
jgi:hypothetical protein